MIRARYVTPLGALAVAWALLAVAAEPPARQYVGVKKCKMCHTSAHAGAQFKIWSESKHSHAYEVLATPRALEVAKAESIEAPQSSPECLKCHVTGYGEPPSHFADTLSVKDGVQCESCHGPGGDYWKRTVMKDLWTGKVKPEAFGLVLPTKETCAKCHNEHATGGKPVNFTADSTKIAHPIPKGAGAEAEEGGKGS